MFDIWPSHKLQLKFKFISGKDSHDAKYNYLSPNQIYTHFVYFGRSHNSFMKKLFSEVYKLEMSIGYSFI